MPFKKLRYARAALAVGAMVLAAPASAMADACPPESSLTKPFAALGDLNDYFIAPGGDFEVGSPEWTVTRDGAEYGEGRVGVFGGPRYLKLRGGSRAVSPEFCVDNTYNHLRLYVQSSSDEGYLRIDAIEPDGDVEQLRTLDLEDYGKWRLTPFIPLASKLDLNQGEAVEGTRLRFTAYGREVRIDAVAVDPYRR
jgi:hypothetical protein